ncbi:MAG: ATP-binding protein [Sandaracinaceae bacterium]|nr:ATP-binding protein [Sandaracinaceae bacterium]
MSTLGTALFALTGVCAYVALYYGALYLARRQHEHLAFAGMCASLAVLCTGAALTSSAESVADAVPSQQLQNLGFLAAVAFFVDFVFHLCEEHRPRLIAATYAWCGVGAGALLAGLFFDPAFSHPAYAWGAAGSLDRPIAQITPLGLVAQLVAAASAAYGVARLSAIARRRPDLRGAAVATGIALAAGALEMSAIAVGGTASRVSAIASVLPVLGFSFVLVGRFTRLEAQLAARTEQLARSYDHLRAAQEELLETEQLATIGELSAVIAHEVKNPLAIIKNAVGGLRRKELSREDGETLLGILDEETDRLNRLVNDLLAYARPISPESGQVDLRTVVMNAVELAAGGRRSGAEVEIELDLEREVSLVDGDEALLRHALLNIADNALQAMPMGGTLTITCRDTIVDARPCVAVDFHDTGEGMDTLVRSKARDPFFTTRQSGTGLGLAIVDRVARVHGGRVEIESRHGQGTTVSFVVPCQRSSVAPATS